MSVTQDIIPTEAWHTGLRTSTQIGREQDRVREGEKGREREREGKRK